MKKAQYDERWKKLLACKSVKEVSALLAGSRIKGNFGYDGVFMACPIQRYIGPDKHYGVARRRNRAVDWFIEEFDNPMSDLHAKFFQK